MRPVLGRTACVLIAWVLAGSTLTLHADRRAKSMMMATQPTIQLLNGEWDFHFDPQGVGEQQRWFVGEGSKDWQKVRVPGSYDDQFPDHNSYAGKAWYRRQFTITQQPPGLDHIILHLAGVVLRSKIWVNGQLAGESVLPYLDLPFDITKYCYPGRDNQLVIETDNAILQRAIPDRKWHGWRNDGGLIWPVYLLFELPVQSTPIITTTMLSSRRWKFGVVIDSDNADVPSQGAISMRLLDAANRVLWTQKRDVQFSSGTTKEEFDTDMVKADAWSPGHPVLYKLQVMTSLKSGAKKSTATLFGFRQIQVLGTKLYLNGAPLTIRGINRHEFYPGVGMSVSPAQNLKDLEDIKALGANFVRLAHYPQTDDVYDDCDKLGLLVWSEMPAWQTSASSLSDPTVWKNYAAPFLRMMVQNYRNHPSIIIWSVANEVPSNLPEVASYITKSIGYVKQLDPTRLVTFASGDGKLDISFHPVDVVAVNEYFGWYYGKVSDLGPTLDLLHSKWPTKPIIVSEYGAGAVPGWTSPPGHESRDYSLQHQAEFLEQHLKQIYAPKRRGYVAGGVIWVYNDFPEPYRTGGDQPAGATGQNSKGIVTQNRSHKPAWNVVRQFYESLTSVH